MYNRRRPRILLAVLVLVALTLITVDFRSDGSAGEGPLGRLRGVASTILGPIQEGLATIVSPIGNSVSAIGGLFDARAENVQLRALVDQLEDRRRSYEDVVRENVELRQLLEIAEAAELPTVAAQVIASGPSNFEFTITLNVGAADGVHRDMPVINGSGLVGKVIQTTDNTARVLLAIDPTFGANATHAQTGAQGTVRGNGNKPLLYEPQNPEAEVGIGEEVVTSRYSNGVFPEGIPIGTVASTDETAGLLSRSVEVRPWVDFTRLQTVLVVQTTPPTGEFEEGFGDVEFVRPEVAPTAPPGAATETETPDPFDPFATDPTDCPTDGSTDGPADASTDAPSDGPTDGSTAGASETPTGCPDATTDTPTDGP